MLQRVKIMFEKLNDVCHASFFTFWREATFIGLSEIVFAIWRKHENIICYSHLSLHPLTKAKYSINFFKS